MKQNNPTGQDIFFFMSINAAAKHGIGENCLVLSCHVPCTKRIRNIFGTRKYGNYDSP